MSAYMKFVFSPVLENRENGLGNEGAVGGIMMGAVPLESLG